MGYFFCFFSGLLIMLALQEERWILFCLFYFPHTHIVILFENTQLQSRQDEDVFGIKAGEYSMKAHFLRP